MMENQIIIYTELTYKMAKYLEVHYRLAVAAINAICNSTSLDTFLSGAYLRMIADATANLFIVNCMSYSLKEKFLDYWLEGKPVNKFKVKFNGEWIRLTTGFIQKNNPHLDRLYKALNPMIHPSKEYLDKIFIEKDNKIYVDKSVPTGSVYDMGLQEMFKDEMDKFTQSMDAVTPTSTEYRELEYLDTEMEYKGEEPILVRIYKH